MSSRRGGIAILSKDCGRCLASEALTLRSRHILSVAKASRQPCMLPACLSYSSTTRHVRGTTVVRSRVPRRRPSGHGKRKASLGLCGCLLAVAARSETLDGVGREFGALLDVRRASPALEARHQTFQLAARAKQHGPRQEAIYFRMSDAEHEATMALRM